MDHNTGAEEPHNDLATGRTAVDAADPSADDTAHWGVECALEFVQLHGGGWQHVSAFTDAAGRD